jgi:hypothetical protein
MMILAKTFRSELQEVVSKVKKDVLSIVFPGSAERLLGIF